LATTSTSSSSFLVAHTRTKVPPFLSLKMTMTTQFEYNDSHFSALRSFLPFVNILIQDLVSLVVGSRSQKKERISWLSVRCAHHIHV
jgi:hypothetical protein